MKKKQTFLKSLLAAILLGAPLAVSAQDVEINETNFPDENFRNWLLQQDYGADGILTGMEISGITYINISNRNISNLTGIEHFTALSNLVCYDNQLTALDLSKNTALRNLDCYDNQLTALDLSKNTALITLDCYDNQLTALDVSGCTALKYLDCCNNQLTALDVPGCTALGEVDCSNNQLTTLDVSGCSTELGRLSCYRNQIKGASMDALINSLPTPGGWLKVYDNSEGDEGNVCTKTQVEAIKAKGWKPYYSSTKWLWEEYEGYDEETGIVQPATATTDANEPVYTLSGQKVSNGSLKGKKGVYIVGGKKVVVK